MTRRSRSRAEARRTIATYAALLGEGEPPEPPRRRSQPEHREQVKLIAWARAAAEVHPELELLHAIPNGGARDRITGARLKAEGVLAGMPDLCLPVPRGPWAGLYIELKRPDGRGQLTKAQERIIHKLRAVGHRVEVCKGWLAARDVILNYLEA